MSMITLNLSTHPTSRQPTILSVNNANEAANAAPPNITPIIHFTYRVSIVIRRAFKVSLVVRTVRRPVDAGVLTLPEFTEDTKMGIFDDTFVNIKCPNCTYELDVELTAIRLEETIFCPCCKITIQLRDENASTYRAEQNIDSALEDLRRSLGKLNISMKL